MSDGAAERLAALSDANLAMLLFAVDPVGVGGIVLRARAGSAQNIWLETLKGALAPERLVRKLPLHAGDDRLFGGLDLAATLAVGAPVIEPGVLAAVDGGVLLLPSAERVERSTAARLGQVLDCREVRIERAGQTCRFPARFGIVAFDEGVDEEEMPPPALTDRLGIWCSLGEGFEEEEEKELLAGLHNARERLSSTVIEDGSLVRLCEAAAALGVDSLRAMTVAIRAACAAAALLGRRSAGETEAAIAARLVLSPRATRLPADVAPPEARESEPAPPEPGDGKDDGEAQRPEDLVLAAARAAIPPGLLHRLAAGIDPRRSRAGSGPTGETTGSSRRGRPAGSRPGLPRGGARLALVETMRAAAPWQKIRARTAKAGSGSIEIRRDDLRVHRLKRRTEAVTVFVVDASGSLAANRLAEAKGAVELLLAECYIRRDEVALLSFRGRSAELVLPPTRSLARAKRCLAAMPGGGATPLATAVDAAADLAATLKRRGFSPVLVFLTDGRANIARDGSPDRARAQVDALAAARVLRSSALHTLVIDAAPRRQEPAETLADAMGARYVPLPRADAGALSRIVGSVTA